MNVIFRNEICIIFIQNSTGIYADVYGNVIRISHTRAVYISTELKKNNFEVLSILHMRR